MSAGAGVVEWAGLIALFASLPSLWVARQFWNAADPARQLLARVLLGDGAGLLIGGLLMIVTGQWGWALVILALCLGIGAVFGVIARQRALAKGVR
jgi:hypothetical protein